MKMRPGSPTLLRARLRERSGDTWRYLYFAAVMN